MDNKSTSIGFRATQDLKDELTRIAPFFGHNPGTLAHMILETFCNTYNKRGSDLIWPPQFNYHLNAKTYLDAIRESDKERLQMVADEPPVYNDGTHTFSLPDEIMPEVEARCASLGITVEEYVSRMVALLAAPHTPKKQDPS